MGALGQNLSDDKVEELMNEIDKDSNGSVDCE